MVHRRPDSIEADITRAKPRRSNCVSPFTSSTRPSEITPTTDARCQLGLQHATSPGHTDLLVRTDLEGLPP